MARPQPPQIDSAGSDSFLDVITNIVGIMIILVMVVGERAKHAPPKVKELDQQLVRDAQDVVERNKSLEGDIDKVLEQAEMVRREITLRRGDRDTLAVANVAMNRQIELKRASLTASDRRDLDADRDLNAAKAELERLGDLRRNAAAAPIKSVKIESYPTPLSRIVDTREAHFQLRGGRICFVPIDALIERFKSIAREKAWRLKDAPEFSDVIGPEGGFRMQYTLERVDLAGDGPNPGGSYIQLSRWELTPVSGQLGETIDEALATDSNFQLRLEQLNPRDFTITLWVYPDSFEEFRRLRKMLYPLGFSVAGRPLPFGSPIGGSPQGSKSAAQ